MAAIQKKIEPKTIALVVGVVLVVALAARQGARALSPAANDVTYTPKVKPPPESARPPGYGTPGGEDKTGGSE